MKICPKCDVTKSIELFGFRNKKTLWRCSWCKACVTAYSAAHPNVRTKQKLSTKYKKWAMANRHKVNANHAAHRAAKKNASPKWLTKSNWDEIAWYYQTAKELRWLSEDSLEVDHIVPLQGKFVSGLHVPWNLQILPKSLNCSKKNKFEGESLCQ